MSTGKVVKEIWTGGDEVNGPTERVFLDASGRPVDDPLTVCEWLDGEPARRRARKAADRAKARAEAARQRAEEADLEKDAEKFAKDVMYQRDIILTREEARRQIEAEKATGLFGGFSEASMARRISEGSSTPAPWLIEGLAKRRYDAELLAQEKAGKTVLVNNLIRSLVLGESFLCLERFATQFPPDAAVGVLDYELDAADTDEQIKRIFGDDLLGADRLFIENLRGTGFTLANQHHADQVVQWCRRHNIRYLVVDVFGEAMRGFGSENFTDDAAAYMFTLRRIAREAELLGTLTVHHASRESTREAKVEGSALALKGRGSQRIEASMDVIWSYALDSTGTRFLSAKGRGRIEVDEVAITFDPETERVTAEKSLVSAGVSGGDARLHTKARRVPRIIEDAGGITEGIGALRGLLRSKGVGGNDGSLNAVIGYAEKQGWIIKTERQGLPTVFRLGDDDGWRG